MLPLAHMTLTNYLPMYIEGETRDGIERLTRLFDFKVVKEGDPPYWLCITEDPEDMNHGVGATIQEAVDSYLYHYHERFKKLREWNNKGELGRGLQHELVYLSAFFRVVE